jgi:hypothetical protein
MLPLLSPTDVPLIVRYGIRFDDVDLKANKSGLLSRRQEALLRSRGLEFASIAGAVVVLSAVLAIFVNVGAWALLVAAEPAALAASLYLVGLSRGLGRRRSRANSSPSMDGLPWQSDALLSPIRLASWRGSVSGATDRL